MAPVGPPRGPAPSNARRRAPPSAAHGTVPSSNARLKLARARGGASGASNGGRLFSKKTSTVPQDTFSIDYDEAERSQASEEKQAKPARQYFKKPEHHKEQQYQQQHHQQHQMQHAHPQQQQQQGYYNEPPPGMYHQQMHQQQPYYPHPQSYHQQQPHPQMYQQIPAHHQQTSNQQPDDFESKENHVACEESKSAPQTVPPSAYDLEEDDLEVHVAENLPTPSRLEDTLYHEWQQQHQQRQQEEYLQAHPRPKQIPKVPETMPEPEPEPEPEEKSSYEGKEELSIETRMSKMYRSIEKKDSFHSQESNYEPYKMQFMRLKTSDSNYVDEVRRLIYAQVPKGQQLDCLIDRISSSNGKLLFTFVLPVPSASSKKDRRMTLMLAQKRSSKLISNKTTYVISLEKKDFKLSADKRADSCFGKLRGHSDGSSFTLYDSGVKSKSRSVASDAYYAPVQQQQKKQLKEKLRQLNELEREKYNAQDERDEDVTKGKRSLMRRLSGKAKEDNRVSFNNSTDAEDRHQTYRKQVQQNKLNHENQQEINQRLRRLHSNLSSNQDEEEADNDDGERQELSSIVFQMNNKVRADQKMLVALPTPSSRFNSDENSKESLHATHLKAIELGSKVHKHMVLLHNIPGAQKRPTFAKNSRLPVAPSVKNFELKVVPPHLGNKQVRHHAKMLSTRDVDSGDEDYELSDEDQFSEAEDCVDDKVVVGLGRIGSDRFMTIVKHPLSPYQAFGIALARYEAASRTKTKVKTKFSNPSLILG